MLLAFAFAAKGASTSVVDVVLTIAVSSIAVAGLLATLTDTYTRSVRRTRGSAIGLVALTLVATLIGSAGLAAILAVLPHGRWTALPAPPSSPTGFASPACVDLDAGQDGITIVADDGTFWEYRVETRGWTRTSYGEIHTPECPPQGPGLTPIVPRSVVARHRIDDHSADCRGRRHYVIAADGRVWEWWTGNCSLAVAFLFGFSALAIAGIGMAAGTARASRSFPTPWAEEPVVRTTSA